MSPTESFDELEQKIAERIEEALAEVKGEFLERLQGARDRLDEVVQSEVATARQETEAAAASVADAEEAKAAALAEVEEAKSLLAQAEEAKQAAIAEAIEAKEAEFAEILGARDHAIAEAEQARDTAFAEAEEARSALMAEAEEVKAAAIAAALEAKEAEFSESVAAKDTALAELEEAKAAAQDAAAEQMQAAVAEARTAAEEAAGGAVKDALQQIYDIVVKIDTAQSQSEILEALLAGSAGFASRSLVFLTQEDGLHGWGAQGFHTDEGVVQDAYFEYHEGTAWAELSEGRGTVLMSGEACQGLCGPLDGSAPEEGVLIPLVLRDRLAAAVYADRLEENSSFQLGMLQLLTFVAGQVLESLPMRERSSTATLRLVTEAPADEPGLALWQYAVPEEPVEEYIPEEVPEPVPVPAEPEEMAAEEAVIEEAAPVEETPEPEVEEPQEAAEAAGFEMEEAVEEPIEAVEEVEEEAAPVEVVPPTEVAPPTEVSPPTQVAPPAAGAEVAPPEDVDGPGWAFTTRRFSSEGGDDVGHEEARRLARLLVTEIKLYNEEQVEEGRRGRNIYRTLKEDIDRSRQIYEERIDETVRTDSDYFRDELVKILAAGDEEVMGI